ncbi:MAG: uncharacterized protein JWM47_4170, partial [Acidimicrobiales bacterium]|nr:uncharacterized protein [Acidimicrobiales bacterium]
MKDRYPIPNIEDLLHKLKGACVFSKLDLASGYHQVAIRKQDRPKTAFITKFGSFEWNVLPFGLCNGPSYFMRMMHKLLKGLEEFCVVYLDDILIFSPSEETHLVHVNSVLEVLRKENLKLQPSKCFFERDGVEFCGFWVDKMGVHTEKGKVEAVREWPAPRSPREIKEFLGLTGFYRRFVHHYAEIAMPMTIMGQAKKENFVWTKECQTAFETLKTRVTEAPVLTIPVRHGKWTLRTDASKVAMGAVLMQQPSDDDDDKVVGYFSRKLKDVETRYPTYDRELLAIKEAILYFRYYLHGQLFTVYTDHASIQHILRQRKLSTRQMGLLDTLQQFDYTIKYWPGARNVVADAFSQRPDYGDEREREHINLGEVVASGEQWVEEVVKQYQTDKYFGPLIKWIKEKAVNTTTNELVKVRSKKYLIDEQTKLLLLKGTNNDYKICIPRGGGLRHQLFHEAHDSELAGHFGATRTYNVLNKRFFWLRMLASVKSYVATCDVCQRVKPSKQMGPLMLLTVPEGRWSRKGIDFIIGLPKSEINGNDCIVTIIDHMTKRAHWYALKETTSAEEFASMFINKFIRLHGVPQIIISDRNVRFMSEFWQALWRSLGTRLAPSTPFHPQTDGQAEKANDICMRYL